MIYSAVDAGSGRMRSCVGLFDHWLMGLGLAQKRMDARGSMESGKLSALH